MLMKKVLLPSVLAIAAAVPSASAQFVINTAEPESVVHIGVRAGVNVSNTSSNEQGFMSDNIYHADTALETGIFGGCRGGSAHT